VLADGVIVGANVGAGTGVAVVVLFSFICREIAKHRGRGADAMGLCGPVLSDIGLVALLLLPNAPGTPLTGYGPRLGVGAARYDDDDESQASQPRLPNRVGSPARKENVDVSRHPSRCGLVPSPTGQRSASLAR
jgi:hypothetical protein